MKISQALKIGNEISGSRFVSRQILKFVENLSDEELVFRLNDTVKKYDEFINLVQSYKDGKPLEYITNKAEFYGLDFYVDERVLIPRFETEILVQKVLEFAKDISNPKICEIGTGSGVICITLKKYLANASITATDISQSAIDVARKNALNAGVDIDFINCSLMDGVAGNFDIIVSNPPYISNSYILDKWVLKEPLIALYAGEKGDEILTNIIKLSKSRARFLFCEMGYDQKESLEKILQNENFDFKFYKDLAKFDRGFCAKNLNWSQNV